MCPPFAVCCDDCFAELVISLCSDFGTDLVLDFGSCDASGSPSVPCLENSLRLRRVSAWDSIDKRTLLFDDILPSLSAFDTRVLLMIADVREVCFASN